MKVAHIITGLERGGAEMMLHRLSEIQLKMGINAIVYSLKSDGELKKKIEESNIDVVDLDFSSNRINISGIVALSKEIKTYNPDIILCWMYHANFFGLIAGKIAGNFPIVWNIRNSKLSVKTNSRVTIMLMKAGAWLSSFPNRIISCSTDAKDVHVEQGYNKNQFTIIPNGYDVDVFCPKDKNRDESRIELGLAPDRIVIGIVGRYDPQKDFKTFIEAASLIREKNEKIEFVMCGTGLVDSNDELIKLINTSPFPKSFHLIGPRDNIAEIYNMFDFLVLSSVSEAFPNVLAEAMLCGVPCVSTDVGDAAYIIGDSGKVVPAKNPQAIANAVGELIGLSVEKLTELKILARSRIVENFSLGKIAQLYKDTYEEVLSAK